MSLLRKVFTDGRLAVIVVAVILLIDQVIKIWVKTTMCLHESIRITSLFYINYIEHMGLAFGMQIGSKVILSAFRFVAIVILVYYLWKQVKERARTSYVLCLSLILGGAIGNLIDCMFYGLCFAGSSEFYTSYFVPFGTGYAPFLMGKVVDMFYFPLIDTEWPDWMPIIGGDHFVFFSPVFNFADASISVGVVLLLLFFRKEISEITLKRETKEGA